MREFTDSKNNSIIISFFRAARGLSACSCLVACVFGNVGAGASFGRSAPPAKNRKPLRQATATIPAATAL